MSKLFFQLNMADESGRLNIIHVAFYVSAIVLSVSHSQNALIAFSTVAVLMGLELWLTPPVTKAKVSLDAETLKQEVDKVAKDLRSLNLKLGFRQ